MYFVVVVSIISTVVVLDTAVAVITRARLSHDSSRVEHQTLSFPFVLEVALLFSKL